MSKCERCEHFHSKLDGQCFEALKGNCDCNPEAYMPKDPTNEEYLSFAYHKKVLSQMHEIHEKIEWLLRAVPGTRNMTDWEFIKTCWHYFINYDFGETWSQQWFDEINKHCQPETVRRARQKVCHVELEQLRLYQEELKTIAKTDGEGSKAYWDLSEKLKQFWKDAKYIPNDIALLKKKKIKETEMFWYSIEEVLQIC